jgi:hypothetical protein
MSRTWVMVDVDRKCGNCGAVIPARTWFIELKLPGVTRVLVRCDACVADMPPLIDWKARAAGDVS